MAHFALSLDDSLGALFMARLEVCRRTPPTTALCQRKRDRNITQPARMVRLALLLASIGALSSWQGLRSEPSARQSHDGA